MSKQSKGKGCRNIRVKQSPRCVWADAADPIVVAPGSMACCPLAFVRGSSSWRPAQVLAVATQASRMKGRSFRQAGNFHPEVVAELLMRASRRPFRYFRARPCLTAAAPVVLLATAAPALAAAMVCAGELTTAAAA